MRNSIMSGYLTVLTLRYITCCFPWVKFNYVTRNIPLEDSLITFETINSRTYSRNNVDVRNS